MYVRRRYGFWMTFNWSKKSFFSGLIYSSLIVCAYLTSKTYCDVDLSLSWQPVSVIGIAVAFYLGFKNNSSYDRTWEARKIWGGIVNSSRTFGAAVCSFIQGEKSEAFKREIIYRHIAWITALRYQLRLSKEWEHSEIRLNGIYAPAISEHYFENLEGEIKKFISHEEFMLYKGKANLATQILLKQSSRLQELRNQNYFEDFRHMEFHKLIGDFYNDQGRSERIKNFPFPRQYTSVAYWITVIFATLIPFGLISIFKDLSQYSVWMAAPISALIIWLFFLMEMIGDYSENPFEGTYNDVPITSISRSIEIDLREMMGETNVPKPIAAENGFLM